MNERAKIALEIGKVKNSTGISAYAPAREDEVLCRVLVAEQAARWPTAACGPCFAS